MPSWPSPATASPSKIALSPVRRLRRRGDRGCGGALGTWVGQGGEGIVLKERTSLHRSGVRSPAWLKLKPKLSLDVIVTDGSTDRIRWGEAVMLAFRYTHPRIGADVEIRQAVRVPRDLHVDVRIGAQHELICWGMMPSGMLGVFVSADGDPRGTELGAPPLPFDDTIGGAHSFPLVAPRKPSARAPRKLLDPRGEPATSRSPGPAQEGVP